jgi:hypothetical protein
VSRTVLHHRIFHPRSKTIQGPSAPEKPHTGIIHAAPSRSKRGIDPDANRSIGAAPCCLLSQGKPNRSKPSLTMDSLSPFAISQEKIHVWKTDLAVRTTALMYLRANLSPGRNTAGRPISISPFQRCFRCHTQHSAIFFGDVSGSEAGSSLFIYGMRKRLAHAGEAGLRFNVSHSAERALIAVSRSVEIGVDIERIRPLDDLETSASQFFCTEEAEKLKSLAVPDPLDSFYKCWTRKKPISSASATVFPCRSMVSG